MTDGKTFMFTTEEVSRLLKGYSDERLDELTFTLYPEGESVKCGGCGWTATRLFVHAASREDAVQLLKDGEAGMCGECYTEYLVDDG